MRAGEPAGAIDWPRLLKVIEMARGRIQRDTKNKPDRGYQWTCYCSVCCEIWRLVA